LIPPEQTTEVVGCFALLSREHTTFMSNSVVVTPSCWWNKQDADSAGKHQVLKNGATFLLVEVTGVFVAGQRW